MKKLLILSLLVCGSIFASETFAPKKLTVNDLRNLPAFNILSVLERTMGVPHTAPRKNLEQAIALFEEKLSTKLMDAIVDNNTKIVLAKNNARVDYYENMNAVYRKYLKNIENFAKRARYIVSSPELIKSYLNQAQKIINDSRKGSGSSTRKILEAFYALNKNFISRKQDEQEWHFIEKNKLNEDDFILIG